MSRRRTIVAAALAAALAGCSSYRIEYRDRPAFFDSAVEGDLPDRVVQPDGTVVVYRNRRLGGDLQKKSRGESDTPFMIREELDGGRVILRALLPEHVLANTMTCIRNQEYQLMWEQLLAERTRRAYAEQGLGPAAFSEFFTKHRRDLAATINRMLHGLPRHEVVSDNLGGGMIRLRFHPTVGKQFRFRAVVLESETVGLKLVRIE